MSQSSGSHWTVPVRLKQKSSSIQPSTFDIGPISCFVKEGDFWHKTDVTPEDYRVSITQLINTQPTPVDYSNNIVAAKQNHFWFLYSPSLSADPIFNNLKSYNELLINHSSAFLIWNDKEILITVRTPETRDLEEFQLGLPKSQEYGIEYTKGKFRFPIYKTLLFGSNPVCDFILEDSRPFEAIIHVFKNNLFITGIEAEKIIINGEETVTRTTLLNHDDVITFSGKEFIVKLPDSPFDPLMHQLSDTTLCLLDVNSSEKAVKKVILPVGSALTIGRGASCDIVIEDNKSVSKNHAQLLIYEDHVLIIDSYSKNGTSVNDNRVGKSRARIGDIISFANKSYLLCSYNI